MRNPDRIDSFMTEMGKLWKERYPDWRFGQLMYNFFSRLGDPFYYEEEELLEAFKAYCAGKDPKEAVKNFREANREVDKVKMESFWAQMETLKNMKFNDK